MKYENLAHPIDYRYGDDKLRKLFSLENIIRTYAYIEGVVSEAQAELGIIPKQAAIAIKKAAEQIDVNEVLEEEKRVKHDIVALVNVLSRKAGKWGEYVHYGLTSSDIKDTGLILLIREALSVIKQKMHDFMYLLSKKACEYIDLPCVGRTHGVHANIYLFGHKFAVFLDEFIRHMERLKEIEKRVLVGKFSGAVGIHTALGEIGEQFEQQVLRKLGLGMSLISTQIIPRDRLTELVLLLSMVSSSLDRFAVEIRNLQRTEISELYEPFSKEQVGSSAMPHKRNPIMSENISGLARIVRSISVAALENMVLWHERDLSNSSTERILFPEIFLLLDEQLSKAIKILEGLTVDREKIISNINMTRGLIYSEEVVMALARKGYGRLKAHKLIRELSFKALKERKHLRDLLLEHPEISSILTPSEIEKLFNPWNYISVAKNRVKAIIKHAEKILGIKINSC